MTKFALLFFSFLFLSFAPLSAEARALSEPKTAGYFDVNGVHMYYEIRGAGEPLVFVHGSYGSIDLNAPLLDKLAEKNQVIAMELQGHARTADTDRPFSYAGFADDIAQLLRHLKVEKANVAGYSLGGVVAAQLAIQEPALVKRVIVLSSVYKRMGWNETVREGLQRSNPDFFEGTILKSEYERLAPDPSHWRAFVTKLSAFNNEDYDLGRDKIAELKIPFLLVKGDNDGVELAHVADYYRALGGDVSGDLRPMPASRLAILPHTNHLSLMEQPAALVDAIAPFLGHSIP